MKHICFEIVCTEEIENVVQPNRDRSARVDFTTSGAGREGGGALRDEASEREGEGSAEWRVPNFPFSYCAFFSSSSSSLSISSFFFASCASLMASSLSASGTGTCSLLEASHTQLSSSSSSLSFTSSCSL